MVQCPPSTPANTSGQATRTESATRRQLLLTSAEWSSIVPNVDDDNMLAAVPVSQRMVPYIQGVVHRFL